jgi:hypothetical protein
VSESQPPQDHRVGLDGQEGWVTQKKKKDQETPEIANIGFFFLDIVNVVGDLVSRWYSLTFFNLLRFESKFNLVYRIKATHFVLKD